MKKIQRLVILPFFLCACETLAQQPDVFFDKKSGKYGYIKDDSTVITPRFQNAESFSGNFAWVKERGKWGLINDHGEWVLPAAYKLHQEAAENFNLVKKKRKYGMVSLLSGKEVVPCLYKKTFSFEEFNGFGVAALVILSRKAGLIDYSGKEKIPCLYDAGKTPFAEAAPRYYQVKQKKKMGLIDWKARLIVPCKFDEVLPTDGDTTTISVKRKKKYGLYSNSGKLIVDCQFERPFSMDMNGFGIVLKNGMFGLLNQKGILVMDCTFTREEDVISAFEKLKKK